MNPLLNSVPGDITGLLRRGSPIIAANTFRGIVAENPAGCSSTLVTLEQDEDTMDLRLEMLHALALDLTDPTGRAHAAAWASNALGYRTTPMGYWEPSDRAPHTVGHEREAIMLAIRWRDMTPEQIDTLARLILRLAGRSP